jgi:hypothetical protein
MRNAPLRAALALVLAQPSCVVYDSDVATQAPTYANNPPYIDWAEASCGWDAYVRDNVWVFAAGVQDWDGAGDLVAVLADVKPEKVKPRQEAADDAPEGVGGIEAGHLPGRPAATSQRARGDRKRAPHCQGRGEKDEADGEPLERAGERSGGGDRPWQRQATQRREGFERRTGPQRMGGGLNQPGDDEGPCTEAGHERRQNQGNRLCRASHLEGEQLEPNDLVDECRGTAGDEQRKEGRGWFHQSERTTPRA